MLCGCEGYYSDPSSPAFSSSPTLRNPCPSCSLSRPPRNVFPFHRKRPMTSVVVRAQAPAPRHHHHPRQGTKPSLRGILSRSKQSSQRPTNPAASSVYCIIASHVLRTHENNRTEYSLQTVAVIQPHARLSFSTWLSKTVISLRDQRVSSLFLHKVMTTPIIYPIEPPSPPPTPTSLSSKKVQNPFRRPFSLPLPYGAPLNLGSG